MKEIDYQDIETYFLLNGYTWKFERGNFIPSPEDIKMAVDKGKEALYDSKVGSTWEMGRLIVQKGAKDFNVFVHVGTTS